MFKLGPTGDRSLEGGDKIVFVDDILPVSASLSKKLLKPKVKFVEVLCSGEGVLTTDNATLFNTECKPKDEVCK